MTQPVHLEQKIWLGAIAVLGIVYVFLLAPFQGNDEWPHWVRAWSVAEGSLKCGPVPKASLSTMAQFPFNPHRFQGKLRFEHVRAALNELPSGELTAPGGYTSAACPYSPLAYLVPAVILRAVALGVHGRPVEGGMIEAFWAARLASWLSMCVAVALMLLAVPWARNLLLLFFSIPEVVQQSVALNNDLMLFVLTFAILAMVLRAPSWRGVIVMAVCVACMTLTKPIFALWGALALPALYELWRTTDRAKLRWRMPLALFGLFVLPIAVRKAWSAYVGYDQAIWLPPWNVHPDQQTSFLLHHPLHLFTIMMSQLRDTFSHELMRGSWRSMLGALGSSAIELRPFAYRMVILGFVSALAGDFLDGRVPPSLADATLGSRLRRWAWILAVASVAIAIPAVVVAMFLLFTSVGDTRVNGVQGRYYLDPLLLLVAFGLYAAKRRWRWDNLTLARCSSVLAAVCAVFANCSAIGSLWRYYWEL